MQPVETWIDRWCRQAGAIAPEGYKPKKRKFKRDVSKEENKGEGKQNSISGTKNKFTNKKK